MRKQFNLLWFPLIFLIILVLLKLQTLFDSLNFLILLIILPLKLVYSPQGSPMRGKIGNIYNKHILEHQFFNINLLSFDCT